MVTKRREMCVLMCPEGVAGQVCEGAVWPSATGTEAEDRRDLSGVWGMWQEDPRPAPPLVPVQV